MIERQRRCGDDEDRNVACTGVRCDFLLNGQAVDGWQHQIEDDEVGAALLENMKRRQTVVCFDHIEGGEAESRAVHASNVGIVFDDKHRLAGSHDVILANAGLNATLNRKLCHIKCGRVAVKTRPH